jgi:hypothetical protein
MGVDCSKFDDESFITVVGNGACWEASWVM